LGDTALKFPKSFESKVDRDVKLEWHESAGAERYTIEIEDNPIDGFLSDWNIQI